VGLHTAVIRSTRFNIALEPTAMGDGASILDRAAAAQRER
jgi:hypothetical protein